MQWHLQSTSHQEGLFIYICRHVKPNVTITLLVNGAKCSFLASSFVKKCFLLLLCHCMLYHSSEIRGLCLMKCSSETFQNLSYFWIMWVFIFQKYGKFWSVSLEHFNKYKPLISEEWYNLYTIHGHGIYSTNYAFPT